MWWTYIGSGLPWVLTGSTKLSHCLNLKLDLRFGSCAWTLDQTLVRLKLWFRTELQHVAHLHLWLCLWCHSQFAFCTYDQLRALFGGHFSYLQHQLTLLFSLILLRSLLLTLMEPLGSLSTHVYLCLFLFLGYFTSFSASLAGHKFGYGTYGAAWLTWLTEYLLVQHLFRFFFAT